MTSDRPYRRAMSLDQALEEIRRGAATQFDPTVVRAFFDLVDDGELELEHQRAHHVVVERIAQAV